MSAIEGLDESISEVLINRSKEALLTIAMEMSSSEEPDDLMSVEGIDMQLAMELKQKGISDKEELAEQSIEELTNLIDITEDEAGKIIMSARAHWFEE